ncbi:hypothetical protein [Paenibacillus taichungensis]
MPPSDADSGVTQASVSPCLPETIPILPDENIGRSFVLGSTCLAAAANRSFRLSRLTTDYQRQAVIYF